jgi:hypothetical protein
MTFYHKTITPAQAVKAWAPPRINCEECRGRGYIKLWPPGHQERACMARCEQCSGMGKVRS